MEKLPKRISRFLEVIDLVNEKRGDLSKEEWRMVTDPKEILFLESDFAKKNENLSADQFHSGVLAEDRFYVFVRIFFERPAKNGQTEFILQNKVFYTGQLFGNSGVAVIAVSHDNKIILNKTWRPSITNWLLETPGTIQKKGENIDDAFGRLLREDFGLEMESQQLLTENFIPDRGITGGVVPIYFVRLKEGELKPQDNSVAGNFLFTLEELEKIIAEGGIEEDGRKYFCHDGYLMAGLYLAKQKGLL